MPTDPELLAARDKYFEEAYDHVNFWTSIHLADRAEHQYLTTAKKKVHQEEIRTIDISAEAGSSKGSVNHYKGKAPHVIDSDVEDGDIVDITYALDFDKGQVWRPSWPADLKLEL